MSPRLRRDVSVWSPPEIFMFSLSSAKHCRFWEEILSEAKGSTGLPQTGDPQHGKSSQGSLRYYLLKVSYQYVSISEEVLHFSDTTEAWNFVFGVTPYSLGLVSSEKGGNPKPREVLDLPMQEADIQLPFLCSQLRVIFPNISWRLCRLWSLIRQSSPRWG